MRRELIGSPPLLPENRPTQICARILQPLLRTVEVESWLHALSLANATKAKVRNVMHVIFAHACRHELLQRNPISLVRQSVKRQRTPDVLDAEELKKLLANFRILPERWSS
jgi:site-specific recombinase XerD